VLASYGGYSAFYLGIHNKRFKTFIAHDGVFNTQVCLELLRKFSLQLGFWRRVLGKRQCDCQKTYTTLTRHWLKNGTLNIDLSRRQDFRVPIGQGQEHFKRHNYAE
jgi:hypothetical protein